ncbi:putative mitochondrial RNA binding complex 1 subunit [Trypanosoma rangeli]|uniref:Putative mitochondrial RNA binding complex 1 subunit n=1 Tax=Trypanosoma rangeli TaxID=5698 RepID=A0A3R7M7X7_TRYRA|nr:putative mitochondrial RNA binding complex 1 subunit [Trypanosoma rangeli]RNF10689.1 putative mitochondrial RNA binding complex 1 subunit [Trypanosoma rangeli]|eukprot:RNF10689.1 putative mitochondrial RNA binding complex 1 subunit [Trypanosoma rangeli]
MRKGRRVVALLDACHCPAYGVIQRLSCCAFFAASSETPMLGKTGTAAFLTPLNYQTRRLHLSLPLCTTAETPVTPGTQSSSASNTAANSGVTALDVAMRVNKLKRLHQTGGGPDGKKQIELDAWSELNNLTEEQINSAEGKAVSLLLNSWAYFAKYWDKGKDGPLGASFSAATGNSSSSSSAGGGGGGGGGASKDVPQDS